jgi:hypothetical protein
MAKNSPRRGDDLIPLEGGATGGGGAGGASVKSTKWSNMPSFKGNASIMDDLKKLTKDTSKLKGGAKKATELATDRAINRLAVRATGATAAGAAAKTLSGKDAVANDKSEKSNDYEDMSGAVDIDVSNPTGVAGRGMKKGGMTASSRADGCATKGKTKGRFV